MGAAITHFMIRTLRIRPEEGDITRVFMWHNFFQGLGLAMLYSTGITSLLHSYEPEDLPLILSLLYISGSLMQIIWGRIYAGFEHQMEFRKLLRRVTGLVVILMAILAVMGYFIHDAWFWILTIIVYRLFYMISSLEFWGLSSVAYDVRQGKRLFGLISAGDILARTLGYLAFKFFHESVSEWGFIALAAGSFLLSLGFMNQCISLAFGRKHPRQKSKAHAHAPGNLSEKWFGSTLNSGIARLAFFSSLIYILLDFFFYSQAKGMHHDHDLQDYILLILIFSEAGTFIVKLIFSGRVYERLGNRNSLLILPLFGAVGTVVYFSLSHFSSDPGADAKYIAILYASFIALRYSLNEPILLALFQPAGQHTRLAGHTGMKTLADPLGMLCAGLLLLLLTFTNGKLSLYWFLPVILLICIFWVASVNPVVKRFVKLLQEAIRKRFIHAGDLPGKDIAAVRLFREKLESSKPSEVLMAIDALEETNDEVLIQQAPRLLGRKEASVQLRMMELVKSQERKELSPEVESLMKPAHADKVRRMAVRTLLDLNPEETLRKRLLSEYLADTLIRSEIILHEWKRGGEDAKEFALAQLRELLNSRQQPDRIAALEVISEGHIPGFAAEARHYFAADDELTRRAALQAIAAVPDGEDLDYLLSLLDERNAGTVLAPAFSEYGNPAISALRNIILENPGKVNAHNAMRALEKMQGSGVLAVLEEIALEDDLRISAPALNALNFRDDVSREMILKISRGLTKRFAQRALLFTTWINDPATRDDLRKALLFEMEALRDQLLNVFQLKYGRQEIRAVKDILKKREGEKKSNALEMLESHLDRGDTRIALALFDHGSTLEQARKLKTALNDPLTSILPISYIAEKGEAVFTPWTIAVFFSSYQPVTQDPLVNSYLGCGNALLEEAAGLAWHSSNTHTSPPMHTHQGQIPAIEKVLVLRGTALFSETPENILATIATILEEEQAEAGFTLFSKGDVGSCMYIIYEGEISITDGPNELARLGASSFFGELALLDSEPRSATATAVSDTKLLRLDQEEFYELMEERPEVLKGIIRILCERIRNLNTKIREIKK